MSERFDADQFLILYPEFEIEGDGTPTRINLKMHGRDKLVYLTPHISSSPLSRTAQTVLALANFSQVGPNPPGNGAEWNLESLPREAHGSVTVLEIIVPKELGDATYDPEANSDIDWDDLKQPLVRATRAANLYLKSLRTVFDLQLPLLPYGHVQGPLLHRDTEVRISTTVNSSQISVRSREPFSLGLGGTRSPDINVTVAFDSQKEAEFDLALADLDGGIDILASKDRLLAAYTSLNLQGDFKGCALDCATSGEMFLDTVLMMLLWESLETNKGGNTDSDLLSPAKHAQIFRPENHLSRRIKTEYNKLLGGKPWTLETGALAGWHQDCYQLRHRVIHAGYNPTYSECQNAISSTEALVQFVLEALIKKKCSFPRTTWMLVGEQGLIKRDAYSHNLKKTLAAIRSEPDWRSSFSAYRQEVSEIILDLQR